MAINKILHPSQDVKEVEQKKIQNNTYVDLLAIVEDSISDYEGQPEQKFKTDNKNT